MMKDNHSRGHDDRTPVAPGGQHSEQGEEVHMHVALPGMAGELIDDHRGHPRERHRAGQARFDAGGVAKPGEGGHRRENGHRGNRGNDGKPRQQAGQQHDGQMSPGKDEQRCRKALAQILDLATYVIDFVYDIHIELTSWGKGNPFLWRSERAMLRRGRGAGRIRGRQNTP
jgi:hypothetical protein